MLKELNKIKEKLINHKEELNETEKRRLVLINSINEIEVLLKSIYIFNIDEIIPIIEELINKRYKSNYKFTIIEYSSTKYSQKYYYVLKEYNLDTTLLDEKTLWDKIEECHIILLGIETAKNDSLPRKISFNPKENNKNIVKFQTTNKDIDDLIRDFIDLLVENELKDDKEHITTILNRYLSSKYRKNNKKRKKKKIN